MYGNLNFEKHSLKHPSPRIQSQEKQDNYSNCAVVFYIMVSTHHSSQLRQKEAGQRYPGLIF
jgi:hypothetical protein